MYLPENIPRVSGSFPTAAPVSDSVPGAKDGTPLHQKWVGDLFAAFQAVLNGASMTPSDTGDTCGSSPGDVTGSQFIEALQLMLGTPGEIVGWPCATIPTGCRLLPLDGTAVDLTDYPRLEYVYCGDTDNPTSAGFYKCTNPANPNGTRSTVGTYFYLPDFRGVFLRGDDVAKAHDPDGDTRGHGWEQGDTAGSHLHDGLVAGGYGGNQVYAQPMSAGSNPGASLSVTVPPTTQAISTTATGLGIGPETRPTNQNVQWCIRY
jgi:hypothetical protein